MCRIVKYSLNIAAQPGSSSRQLKAAAEERHYESNKTMSKEGPIMDRVELNTQAPEFTLTDFNGNSVSLSDFTERKNVLVVFNRGFV